MFHSMPISFGRSVLQVRVCRTSVLQVRVRLTLTTAYNPEANGKIERGHSPIVKALVKACDGRVKDCPQMLPYALWADRTTHSSVIGYMPTELMTGQASSVHEHYI